MSYCLATISWLHKFYLVALDIPQQVVLLLLQKTICESVPSNKSMMHQIYQLLWRNGWHLNSHSRFPLPGYNYNAERDGKTIFYRFTGDHLFDLTTSSRDGVSLIWEFPMSFELHPQRKFDVVLPYTKLDFNQFMRCLFHLIQDADLEFPLKMLDPDEHTVDFANPPVITDEQLVQLKKLIGLPKDAKSLIYRKTCLIELTNRYILTLDISGKRLFDGLFVYTGDNPLGREPELFIHCIGGVGPAYLYRKAEEQLKNIIRMYRVKAL